MDINGNYMIDAPGTIKYLGPGNNGWRDFEYLVAGGAGEKMIMSTDIDEAYNPVIISSSDSGIDTNGDGVWDHLEITVSLNIPSAGEYTLSGILLSDSIIVTSRSNVNDTIIPTSIKTLLSPGITNVKIRFSGEDIRRTGFDGNYVADLQIYDQDGKQD